MSTPFRYTARAATGRMAHGYLEAENREEALARLRQRELTPVTLQRVVRDDARPTKLTDRAAADLCRTLAQLLGSGLPLIQALQFASDELQGPAAAAAQRLREATERGERPSKALEAFAGPQARLLSGVILAGETSGRLAEALEVAATAFVRAAELRARVGTAMIYPAFVMAATLATLTAFVFFVVPSLAGAFEGSESQLPESTRRLLTASAWLKAHGALLAAGVGALGAFAWTNLQVRSLVVAGVDRVLSSRVGLGIAPRLDFSAYAALAALSLAAGVPGAAAYEAAAAGVRSPSLRKRLASAVLAIRLGERPSRAIERAANPPQALSRLMQLGEETGDLAAALRQAADLLQAEAEQRMQRLGAIAGPLVTMSLGGLVASVVLSLFLGLLSMSDIAAR